MSSWGNLASTAVSAPTGTVARATITDYDLVWRRAKRWNQDRKSRDVGGHLRYVQLNPETVIDAALQSEGYGSPELGLSNSATWLSPAVPTYMQGPADGC
ncbi:hypothetical protein [Streptomyces sp. Tue6028]|uniref:hypothetical protein n=1 Tax=Streptomyces sp. Tue6028 TaxID=2036037 RepID=UPI003D71E907